MPRLDARRDLQVGERAELYSLQLEQSVFMGASKFVDWVSRDDPSAGYDIEVRIQEPARRVEVKGSRGSQLAFILSVNELDKARLYGEQYEIHFWGEIRLSLHASDDYRRLREAGYPKVIKDPASVLFSDGWTCEPSEYRVRWVTGEQAGA